MDPNLVRDTLVQLRKEVDDLRLANVQMSKQLNTIILERDDLKAIVLALHSELSLAEDRVRLLRMNNEVLSQANPSKRGIPLGQPSDVPIRDVRMRAVAVLTPPKDP